MGYYINPQNETKEGWLAREGRPISEECYRDWQNFATGPELPVALINNGLFTAANISFDKEEIREFSRNDDKREKIFFSVDKIKLFQVCPEFKEFFERQYG